MMNERAGNVVGLDNSPNLMGIQCNWQFEIEPHPCKLVSFDLFRNDLHTVCHFFGVDVDSHIFLSPLYETPVSKQRWQGSKHFTPHVPPTETNYLFLVGGVAGVAGAGNCFCPPPSPFAAAAA